LRPSEGVENMQRIEKLRHATFLENVLEDPNGEHFKQIQAIGKEKVFVDSNTSGWENRVKELMTGKFGKWVENFPYFFGEINSQKNLEISSIISGCISMAHGS